MYYTYILRSLKNNKYYIGYTSNLEKRLEEHNFGRVSFTKRHIPWELYCFEKFEDIKKAIQRERQIKLWKSRAMIEKLKFKIEDPRPRL
jgi:putative endonuclease